MQNNFSIGILGLGGVGGFFGAFLAKYAEENSDLQVHFIGRGENQKKIAEKGIFIHSENGDFIAKPTSTLTVNDPFPPLDILLVCTKSYDLESAIDTIKDKIPTSCMILPLLNGVDAAERVKKIMPKHTLLIGCVYVFARLIAHGVIQQTGITSSMHFGPENECTVQLFAHAKKAGINAFIYTDPYPVIWEKWSVISTTASLNCYYNGANEVIVNPPEHLNFYKQLHDEFCAVAKACGIILPTNLQEKTIHKIQNSQGAKSSMYADYEKGHRTEVETLVGHLVDLAHQHRINIPCYEAVYASIKGQS